MKKVKSKKVKGKKGKVKIYILLSVFCILYLTGIACAAKDGSSKIKKTSSATYETVLKGGDKVEIGGKSGLKFEPHVKLNRWGGECFIECSIPDDGHSALVVENNKVKWVNAKTESHLYTLDDGDLGGFEWEVILKEKPLNNIITWNIKTQGLEFYYQPPLNQEQLEEGQTANEEYIYDENGDIVAYRPINVVGSYAVYHATRTNMHRNNNDAEKYKYGKAFHIYRPKITDAAGEEIWGVLNVNKQKDVLSIAIDNNWLNHAVYPVSVDPNFGYEGEGGTNLEIENDIRGSEFTITEAGTADSITAYLGNSAPVGWEVKCAIYNSDHTFNDETEEVLIPASTNDWATFNFSDPKPSLTADTAYILVAWAKSKSGAAYGYYDAGAENQGHHDAQTYDGWPDPGIFVHNTNRHFIYCTYTASGAGAPTGQLIIVEME